MASSALLGTIAFVIGQACNLAFQLLLLTTLGASVYGRVGLAHLALVTLMFVADLGYGLYFLREQPAATGWMERWRMALGHRLFVTLVGVAIMMAFWLARYGSDDLGLYYLLASTPAALAALFNFSSPFLAAGRQKTGFFLQQIAWPVTAVVFATAWLVGGRQVPQVALVGGAAVSAGFLTQAFVNLLAVRRLLPNMPAVTLLLPALGHEGGGMLRASMAIASLGFLGVANERMTAFLIEVAAPSFLPAYLLLGQLLGGASGVLLQFNRLLVASEARDGAAGFPVHLFGAAVAALLSVLLLGAILIDGTGCARSVAEGLRLGVPLLTDWGLGVVGGVVAALLIGRRREGALARAIMLGVAVSMAGQLVGAALGVADVILWTRVAGALVALVVTTRLAAVLLPQALPAAILAAGLTALMLIDHVPWPVPTLAAIAALAVALGRDGRRAYRTWLAVRQNRHQGLGTEARF